MISSSLSSVSVDACAGAVDVDELATGGVSEAGTVCVDEAGMVGVDEAGTVGVDEEGAVGGDETGTLGVDEEGAVGVDEAGAMGGDMCGPAVVAGDDDADATTVGVATVAGVCGAAFPTGGSGAYTPAFRLNGSHSPTLHKVVPSADTMSGMSAVAGLRTIATDCSSTPCQSRIMTN